jgi:oxygen-dependent protoporphyrinogen oxidase
MNKRRCIVIGAGLAGLAAAYRLQQAGFDILVLEKEHRVGGRVLTQRRDGYIIDAGPDAMTEGYRHYKALAAEVGLERAFVPSSSVVGVVRNGRVIDIDTASPWRAVMTPALSWPAKIRFVSGLLRHRRLFAGVDPSRLTDSAAYDSDCESARTFALAAFGQEATDYLIDPLMRLVTATGATRVSRLNVLAALLNWSQPLINVEGGLDALPLALAKRLTVTMGVVAEQVTETPVGVEVRYRNGDGALQVEHADGCVIATTYEVARKLHTALPDPYSHDGGELSHVGLVSVSLAYSAATVSRSYVVQVPTAENGDLLLIFLQHHKAPDRAPPGHSLVTLYTDSAATSRYLAKHDDDIMAWARGEIERLFPELQGHFEFSVVSRWPVAGYLAKPGFWKDTRALLDASSGAGRVQLAGDIFGGGSMESAVTWGEAAARNLIEHRATLAQ